MAMLMMDLLHVIPAKAQPASAAPIVRLAPSQEQDQNLNGNIIASQTDTDLSKDTENPIAHSIVLPLRYEAAFNNGAYRATKRTFLISQALIPFQLSDDWVLITRTKLTAVSQPPTKLGSHWTSGLSNSYTTFFLSPREGSGLYWGVGPVLYYPSSMDVASSIKSWGTGPSAAFIKRDQSPWVLGLLINNIWSFGNSPKNSDRINTLLVNPVFSYHFGDGWSVGSSPSITANWLSGEGQRWTVPVGGGISKLIRLGRQPVQLAVSGFYNAIRPRSGNDDWVFQTTLTFVYP